MGGDGLAKGIEQGAVKVMFGGAVFRVPLHADAEGRRGGDAHRLDGAVIGYRLDHQALGQTIDALGMQRVDHDLAGAIGQVLQGAARRQRDPLARCHLHFHGFFPWPAVIEMRRYLVHVLMQATAQGNVHFLYATADAEQGHVAFYAGAY